MRPRLLCRSAQKSITFAQDARSAGLQWRPLFAMLRRILVPLDLSPYSQQATERACSLAKLHNARVTGMTVLDLPEIAAAELPFHAAVAKYGIEHAAKLQNDAKARIADGLKRFAETCEAQGVTHMEAEFQGVPANCILEAANYYDLVVMGLRTFYHFETQAQPGDTLDKVLDHSITPVLAVPKHGDQPYKKVLVAFDGSPNSVRALRALAGFEPVEDLEITLLNADKNPDRGKFYLDQAAAFLRSHRFESIEVVAGEGDIGEIIDDDYIEQTDLIVTGVHAKHRLKSFFVGSLPQRLIDYGHTALLLGQ
jgi:nucleotide-binding universal stress UspA family protein